MSLRKKCSYLELFWPAFSRIRTEYSVHMRIELIIQSECGEMQDRITPNTDTYYAVRINQCNFVFLVAA